MAWPDDLAEQMKFDNRVWNDVETITYYAKTTEKPPAIGVPVERTLWLSIRKDWLKSDSLLATMDMTVDLAKEHLGGIVPKIGDVMKRADNTRWVLELVEVVAAGQEYRVYCTQSRKGP